MEVEIRIEPGRQEPKLVILAGEESGELRRLAESLSKLALGPVPVSRGEEKLLLPQGEFLRFYADGKGVSAQTPGDIYSVHLRLYELEERLDATRFVRISNSEIVNLDRVTAVDLSLSGTIRMTLDGTVHAYVSRRYMKKIKETLNGEGGTAMEINKRAWQIRVIIGGGAGLLVTALFYKPLFVGGFSVPPGCVVLIDTCGLWGAVAAAAILFAALGATVAVATLPFADDGPTLLRRSLFHLAVTALEVSLILWLCVCMRDTRAWALCMVALVLLYAMIWLGRWIGWYVEVMQLRTLLGLNAGPSPLKWRETLPYLPFVLLLCDALPLAMFWIDRTFIVDVPVLSGLLLPYIMLPAAGFCSGLSLGKRQGVCPLYPVACFVCYLPMVFLLFNSSAVFHCYMVAVPALAGNVLGWMYRRAVPKP